MRKRLTRLASLFAAGWLALATPAGAGDWKHQVVANNGDELSYRDNGKLVFYLGCGRGFALHVKYPGPAKKQGEAAIAISTAKGRMTFNGEFEDPETFEGTDFRQTYLGYLKSDPRVFGKQWNAIKSRLHRHAGRQGSGHDSGGRPQLSAAADRCRGLVPRSQGLQQLGANRFPPLTFH